MSRPRLGLKYDTAHAPAKVDDGIDPDVPIEGYYRHKLRSGGMAVAVHLWFGSPIEPWTGEVMDRAPTWNCTINGKWANVADVWPRCALNPITGTPAEIEAEARHLIALQEWGEANGHEAMADPRQKLSPLSTPLQF